MSGVREITLLGQTVNAYGRHELRCSPAERVAAMGFAALLGRLAELPGIERLRYTSPHPLFFDDDLIRAHAELPELCPHVHLPVQSGSDRVLRRMRRRHSASDYRRLLERLGDPQEGLRVIHVAGSKGKGSTALLAEALLRAAGRDYVNNYSATP